MRIELSATTDSRPGHGLLRLRGWEGDSQGLELSVQRNQDQWYLAEDGQWTGGPVWRALPPLQAVEEGWQAEVGPWLVDPLVQDSKMIYLLTVRQGEQRAQSVLKLQGNLLASAAAGRPTREAAPLPVEPPPLAAEPPRRTEPAKPLDESPMVASREPEPPRPARNKPEGNPRRWLLLAALALLLVLLAAAAWWWLTRTSAPASEPQAGPAEAAAACSSQALAQTSDDLLYIQACLRDEPGSQQVLEVIAAAKQAKRCGVVQRLYAHKAQAGDATVALAYASEYDPQTHQAGGCIPAADAETARYWYELVLLHDEQNAVARERLEALKP